MAQDDSKYTDPELRAEIKEDIQASDKGGQPGGQPERLRKLTAAEYKKAMQGRGEEPYTTDKSEQSENQKHLSEWTKEDWQTSDGSGNAKQEDGTERRYLPKKAWESMTEEEKRETDEMKVEGNKEGKQYVPNTDAAKKARKDAQDEHAISDETGNTGHANGTPKNGSAGTKHKRSTAGDNDADEEGSKAAKKAKGEDGEEIVTKSGEDQDDAEDGTQNQEGGGERGDGEGVDESGGGEEAKGEGEHGQPGSSERLPKEGQDVHWKVGRNWAQGTVVEILHEEKDVNGIHAKASQGDPRVVVKSAKSGKTAVYKPDAVFF